MPDIGFSLQPQYDLPITQVIALLNASGFSAVSPVWSPALDLESIAASTQKHNMTIQSLHAPHRNIPLLWNPDSPLATEAQRNIFFCTDACAYFQIPIMVLHGWSGLIYTFPKEPLNFRIFDEIVDYAQKLGVCVAFENLEGEEYLNALLTRYQGLSHIGFCWDSGHDHCYPHALDFLESFGDQLIMTHINDNLGLRDPSGIPSGDDDLHFLPYDGNIRWDDTIRRLKNAPRQAILNFELKLGSPSANPKDLLYDRIPLKDFLKEAGNRARQIALLYEKLTSENI